jgi:hypothetical protein
VSEFGTDGQAGGSKVLARAGGEKKAVRSNQQSVGGLIAPSPYFFPVIDEVAEKVPSGPIPKISLKGEQRALYSLLSPVEAVE